MSRSKWGLRDPSLQNEPRSYELVKSTVEIGGKSRRHAPRLTPRCFRYRYKSASTRYCSDRWLVPTGGVAAGVGDGLRVASLSRALMPPRALRMLHRKVSLNTRASLRMGSRRARRVLRRVAKDVGDSLALHISCHLESMASQVGCPCRNTAGPHLLSWSGHGGRGDEGWTVETHRRP